MAVTWPSTLPVPQRSGHDHVIAVAQRGTTFTAGNTRRRISKTTPPELFSCSWILSQAQLDIFEAFWQGVGDNGAADIDGLQHYDSTGLVVSGASGVPSVRFVGSWTAPLIGVGMYRLSAQIERAQNNLMSRSSFYAAASPGIDWNAGSAIDWNAGTHIEIN